MASNMLFTIKLDAMISLPFKYLSATFYLKQEHDLTGDCHNKAGTAMNNVVPVSAVTEFVFC